MSSTIDLLDGYMPKADFAKSINVHERTIDNYRREPDGLPSIVLGGKVYISVEGARTWFQRRIKQPNPVRRAG